MLSPDYPVEAICQVVGLARSSYYYRAVVPEEVALKQAIEQVAARFPTYGTRRITAQLRRDLPELTPLNRKRVQRVMRESSLLIKRNKRVLHTTNSNHSFPRFPNLAQDLDLTSPNQVWVCDITYIKLGRGDFVYLAIVLDVFTRALRGWALTHGLGVELTLAALHRALAHGTPQIHIRIKDCNMPRARMSRSWLIARFKSRWLKSDTPNKTAMLNESSERSKKKRST